MAAIRKLKSGEVQIPLTCGWCESPSIASELRLPNGVDAESYSHAQSQRREVYVCMKCSRQTSPATAHAVRRQRLAAFIRQGVDIDLRSMSSTHPPPRRTLYMARMTKEEREQLKR